MGYLVIPYLRAQSANIHNASFLLGGAPILPAYFFAHALSRKFGFSTGGIALVHHYLAPQGQFFYGIFHPQQRRGASFSFGSSRKRDYSSKNEHALSLQPVATGNISISIIAECEGLRTLDGLDQLIAEGRFSGGTILGFGPPKLFQQFDEALDSIASGFAVVDRKDLLEPKDGKNPAQLLVDALGTRYEADSHRSWLSAACVGYAGISPFEKRHGAREGYEHAFVEPLIGLIQYRSLRACRDLSSDLLWHPEWREGDVFRVFQEDVPN